MEWHGTGSQTNLGRPRAPTVLPPAEHFFRWRLSRARCVLSKRALYGLHPAVRVGVQTQAGGAGEGWAPPLGRGPWEPGARDALATELGSPGSVQSRVVGPAVLGLGWGGVRRRRKLRPGGQGCGQDGAGAQHLPSGGQATARDSHPGPRFVPPKPSAHSMVLHGLPPGPPRSPPQGTFQPHLFSLPAPSRTS